MVVIGGTLLFYLFFWVTRCWVAFLGAEVWGLCPNRARWGHPGPENQDSNFSSVSVGSQVVSIFNLYLFICVYIYLYVFMCVYKYRNLLESLGWVVDSMHLQLNAFIHQLITELQRVGWRLVGISTAVSVDNYGLIDVDRACLISIVVDSIHKSWTYCQCAVSL